MLHATRASAPAGPRWRCPTAAQAQRLEHGMDIVAVDSISRHTGLAAVGRERDESSSTMPFVWGRLGGAR